MMRAKLFTSLLLAMICALGCAPDPTATPPLADVPSPTFLPITQDVATPTLTEPILATNSPAPTQPVSKVNDKFVFAPGDGSIWIEDAPDAPPRALVKPTPNLFADSPAFSPDGNRVIYTASILTIQGAAQNSIHLIDADGKNDKALAIPPDAKTSFGWPAFSPDGKWVYYTASYPVPPDREYSEIQRVPFGGGGAQSIIKDARSAVLSADDTRMAFLRFNFKTFSAALWTAESNGKNEKLLVPDDLFAGIAGQSFSPDGKWVLFAASGPPTRAVPTAFNSEACDFPFLCWLAQPAYADGLPWDLWLVSSDGKNYRRLTKIGADSPWPAWSTDGNSVAFFDTRGIFRVDVAQLKVSQVNKNGGHGKFDWWSPKGS